LLFVWVLELVYEGSLSISIAFSGMPWSVEGGAGRLAKEATIEGCSSSEKQLHGGIFAPS
jgi:hypothetical protein